MITYATDRYEKIYAGRIVSVSTIVCILIYFLIIVIPFVLVFATNNFWITFLLETDQPKITIQNQYFVSVLRQDQRETFTNIYDYEKSSQAAQIPGAKINTQSIDNNSDGKIEELQVDISFNGNADQLQQIFIMIYVDIEISILKYKAKSYLMFDATSDAGISSLQIYGTTKFTQESPLAVNNFLQIDYNYDIIKQNNFDISDTFIEYYSRANKLISDVQYQKIPGNSLKKTEISINLITDRSNPILIKPSILASVKFAWLQYFSVFLPLLFFFRMLLRFLYRFRFTNTYRTNNMPPEFKEF